MELEIGEQVELTIGRFTHVGITVLINDEIEGMLYKNEVYQKVREGQRLNGFVKKLREDGKVDVCLQKQGYEKPSDLSEQILAYIKEKGGTSDLTDKSDADIIAQTFKVSKKKFKAAIGLLYKERKILIEKDRIRLPSA